MASIMNSMNNADDIHTNAQKYLHQNMINSIRTHANNGKEISVVIDDSSPIYDKNKSYDTSLTTEEFWVDKLGMAGIIADIVSKHDVFGTNMYFLNDPPIYGIKNNEQLMEIIQEKNKCPNGIASISDTLKKIYKEREAIGREKIFIVITNNMPKNIYNNFDVPEFREIITKKPRDSIVMMITCSKIPMTYVTHWNRTLPGFVGYSFSKQY